MRIYGHRGAKGEAPENTLAGFEHAYRHGVRCFELDVQLSADGKPIVVHDVTLARTTGKGGYVAHHTAEQMGSMEASRGHPADWPVKTAIPTLDAVLEACPAFEHLQLEVKSDSRQRMNVLCNRLVELVQRHQWHQRITLTSRDAGFLRLARRHSPRISLGLVVDRRFPNPVKLAQRLQCNYLCANARLLNEATVATAHKAGMHVSAWTVNRIHDMLELEKRGVDSIITDYPTSTLIYFENREKHQPPPPVPDTPG